MRFVDRRDAGRQLAQRLQTLREENVVVLGLPRGGVPVAFEVARALGAPLDVIVVRKLGVPYQPELALGAIGEDDVRVVDDELVRLSQVSAAELAAVEQVERAELWRRVELLRGDRPRIPLTGRTALVVDDGVATGSTARAACQVARVQGAARVILAVPVGAPDAVWALGDVADEVVCLHIPAGFYAVGQWYRDFTQTSDDEVAELLRRAREGLPAPAMAGAGIADPPVRDEEVAVFVEPVTLAGHLTIPEDSVGLVVFAHGSGSSRHSPRNRYVADILHQAKLGTLLFDLLTQDEERDRARVFDIELLANRLAEVTVWLATQPEAAGLRIGYFGASTGAAAALCAAIDSQVEIHAVVSRGGRPDLAASRLAWVRTPTLLIVGSRDEIVLDLNRRAQAAMHCETQLAVVPGATHLFEEPGTLRHAALLACDWFIKHLAPAAPSSGSKT